MEVGLRGSESPFRGTPLPPFGALCGVGFRLPERNEK